MNSERPPVPAGGRLRTATEARIISEAKFFNAEIRKFYDNTEGEDMSNHEWMNAKKACTRMRGTNNSLSDYTAMLRLELPGLPWPQTFAMATHIADTYKIAPENLYVTPSQKMDAYIVKDRSNGTVYNVSRAWLTMSAHLMMEGIPPTPVVKDTSQEDWFMENIYTNKDD